METIEVNNDRVFRSHATLPAAAAAASEHAQREDEPEKCYYGYDDDDSTKKKKTASETYLESSPLLKLTSRKLYIKTVDGRGAAASEDGDSDDTSGTADISASSSTNTNARKDDAALHDDTAAAAAGGGTAGIVPATYKTHVFEVMQRMEKSHELILRQQDEKSLAFRRRIDDLINSIEVEDGDQDDDDEDDVEDDVDVDFGDDHDDDCCGGKMTAKGKTGGTTITGDGGTVATAASTYMYEASLATNKSHDSMDNIDCDSCEYHDHIYDQYADHHYVVGHRQQHHQPNRSPSSHHVVIGNLPLLDEEKPLEKTSDAAALATAERQLASSSSLRRSSPSSSYTSIFVLRKEVDRMKSELDNVKTENSALRTIKLSYQNRTIQEINHSRSLEQQVCMLERKVQELLVKNTEQEKISEQFQKQCRVERMKALSQGATLQHKNERVRRDFDKLWKQYKTSQHQLTESQRLAEDLQEQVRQYEQKEVKWQKEKSFMKDKLDFTKTKNTKLSRTLKVVREEYSTKIADLNSNLHDLQQQLNDK
mmetsp:Transcript_46731/g.113890  ORF Transcript_46731/g.113890 Transcript_46731/m.113890 type:complete len:538 (-) Transcript_46731:137-1750(-)